MKPDEVPSVDGTGPVYRCGCCQLKYPGDIREGHPNRVCRNCMKHLGQDSSFAGRDHTRLAAALVEETHRLINTERTAHSEATTQLSARLDAFALQNRDLRTAIRDGLGSMPAETMSAYFETDAVAEAVEKRDAAYRARGYTMATLWLIDRDHHATSERNTRCSCGNSTCNIAKIMVDADEVRPLRKWETQQIERLRSGRPHSLPSEHPDVLLSHGRIA